jgi:CRISPR/Cas system CSM-associated protein Csm3 (group 7 of RAMP superfamily)
VSVTRLALTSISRERRSYAEVGAGEEKAGTLHVLERIDAGAAFSFEVLVTSSRAAELKKIQSVLTTCVPEEGIGGSASRGLGKARFVDVEAEEVPIEAVEKRGGWLDASAFELRLLSPMVLDGQPFLAPETLLEASRRAYTWCFHGGKPKLPEITLEKRRQSAEMISGWSLKTGMRRAVEPAISAGSAYRFEAKEANGLLAQSMAALECLAIGGYKTRGFGQIVIREPGVDKQK